MNIQNITLEGNYYDGRQPIALLAALALSVKEAIVTSEQISESYQIHLLKVSPRTGHADRFINLPNGAQFQCADQAVLDFLPQESQSEGPVAWLEGRWGIALAGVAIIISILLAGYFYVLPIAAEHVAARVPIETERILGQQALVWLDNHKWFKPTGLGQEQQKRIRDGFAGLISDLPTKGYYRLELRSSTYVGANAFALPGGTIVITDDMVKKAESLEEVLAVLAHEIGHVELRHTLRSVLQGSAVAVVAATITADAASLSVAVSSLPALLAQTKYSRQFETAADDYAFSLLKQRSYSPAAFASIMERLAEKHTSEERAIAYISTHPITAERVKRARDAARSGRGF